MVAAPASGTTRRFATTPTSESWLKWAAMIGVTAHWAVRLTAMGTASHGGQPWASSASRTVGVA